MVNRFFRVEDAPRGVEVTVDKGKCAYGCAASQV